ncbi:hypothetical protein, partial [uncultured Dialister sp.]|uniref:hypothetical protein n=1 Tax=uncultured Dialister sp. TaxID=278064 RepID=UPI0026773214
PDSLVELTWILPLIGFSVFCVAGKKFHIAGKGTGFFCAFLLCRCINHDILRFIFLNARF